MSSAFPKIKYTDHRTNVSVIEKIEGLAGWQTPLLECAKFPKLKLFEHFHQHLVQDPGATIIHGRAPQRHSWLQDPAEQIKTIDGTKWLREYANAV